MSQTLFLVGEIVVLQSKMFPEFNGEYTILAYAQQGESYFDSIAKKKVMRMGGSGYVLDIGDTGASLDDGSPGDRIWAESALRKRHTPGEYSFDALMQILSMPIDRRDFA